MGRLLITTLLQLGRVLEMINELSEFGIFSIAT